ncbi:MAG: VacJ family lipoprotein [Congregibacter sp.]
MMTHQDTQDSRAHLLTRGEQTLERKFSGFNLIIGACFLLATIVSFSSAFASAADNDPLEIVNRPIFVFNDAVDRVAIRPLAKGYDVVMPPVAQRGVNNFFSNLYDVTSALNSALQWRWDGAAHGTARFLVNSTLGVAGIFDVATPLGIDPRRTDFGHTLAIWGVPEGPYIMLPLLGPRTFRSGAGTLVDTFALSIPPYVDDRSLRNSIWATELIHLRAQFLESDELISGDRYIFLRDAYLQQRASIVNEGKVIDSFSDFEDDWTEEF